MLDPTEVCTLAGVVDELTRRGFTEHFVLREQRLRGTTTGGEFGPDQVVVSEYHRFEGISDPDDMSIVYAIETRNGVRGTLTDAFGVYSDPGVGDFMEDVRALGGGPRVCVHGGPGMAPKPPDARAAPAEP